MAGHTQGPWGSAANTRTGAFRIVCNYGVIIAERSGWPSNEAESAANARLVAAAPDLLEAVKLALPYMQDACDSASPADQDFVEAAIAKAEQST